MGKRAKLLTLLLTAVFVFQLTVPVAGAYGEEPAPTAVEEIGGGEAADATEASQPAETLQPTEEPQGTEATQEAPALKPSEGSTEEGKPDTDAGETGKLPDVEKPEGTEEPEQPEETPQYPDWYNPEETVYSISTAGELAQLAELAQSEDFTGKTVQLTTDISGFHPQMPIGTEENPFTGSFDGGHHTISFAEETAACGLFGSVKNGKLTNLRLTGARLSGGKDAQTPLGALAQKLDACEVNCVWLEDVTLEGTVCGGIAGSAENTAFYNCLVSNVRSADGSGAAYYVGGSTSGGIQFRCCVALNGGREGAAIVKDYPTYGDYWDCFSDAGFTGGRVSFSTLRDEAFSNGTAAYRLSHSSWQPEGSKTAWAVENGVTAPVPFLTENAKQAVALKVILAGDGAGGTLYLDGTVTSAVGAVAYGFAGDQHTIGVELPALPYTGKAAATAAAAPDGLTVQQDGTWLYTMGSQDETVTISVTPVGGYDISWYQDNPDAKEFHISTPDEMVGLALLVKGSAPGVAQPVSFQGCTIYLDADLTLPEQWIPIGTAKAPFSGTLTGEWVTSVPTDRPEKADEPAGTEEPEKLEEPQEPGSRTITLSGTALFGYLSGGQVSHLILTAEKVQSQPSLANAVKDGSILNCVNRADVRGSGEYGLGGLVGQASGTRFESCVNKGNVSISEVYQRGSVGGLAGVLIGGSVSGSSNGGAVTGGLSVGGLVGYTGSRGTTTFLHCSNSGSVSAGNYAGGIVGRSDFASTTVKLEHCVNTGGVAAKTSYAGGIAGSLRGGTLTDCENKAEEVQGSSYVGGIVGSAQESTLTDCRNTAPSLTAEGGVAGMIQSCTLNSCSNSAAISGAYQYIGGIVGSSKSSCTLTGCINTGSVSSQWDSYKSAACGGIVGSATDTTAKDCRNEGEIIGLNDSISAGGCLGGTAGTGDLTGCINHGAVTGGIAAAGIACMEDNGTSSVEQCVNTGAIRCDSGGAGGILEIPQQELSRITRNGAVISCVNRGAVTAATLAGGILPCSSNMSAVKCRNYGDVTVTEAVAYYGKAAGGIVGDGRTTVSGCLNAGKVTIRENSSTVMGAGGIIGTASDSGKAVFCVSLTAGTCQSVWLCGGITGSGWESTENCFVGPDVGDGVSDYEKLAWLTQEELSTGAAAWKLNSLGASWGQDGDAGIPIPADTEHPAIRRLIKTVSGEGTVTVSPDLTYLPAGTALTVTLSPAEGMVPVLLLLDGTDLRGETGQSKAVMPDRDCTLEASFAPAPTQEECTVTFQPENGGEATTQTVKAGEKAVAPPQPSYSGHIFLGWYTQQTGGTLFSFDTAITTDLTLYARWRGENTVTVYFHGNGGTPELTQMEAERGSTVTPPEVHRENLSIDGVDFVGYVLDGWTTQAGIAWDGTAAPTAGNTLHVYAKWKEQSLIGQESGAVIQLSTAEQLIQLARQVEQGETFAGCSFQLTEDVTLDNSWRIAIGSYDEKKAFEGEFYAREGAKIIFSGTVSQPLFGYLGESASVHDLTLTGTAEQMRSDSGSVAAWNAGTVARVTLQNLTLGTVRTERLGGVVGWNMATGLIEGCAVRASHIRGVAVGGIVSTNGGTVQGCTVGEPDDGSTVECGGAESSWTHSNFDSTNNSCKTLGAGGVAGINLMGTVKDCLNRASIVAQTDGPVSAGGVVGVWRRPTYSYTQERGAAGSGSGAMEQCTNEGKMEITASYPIVGGVLGMYSGGGTQITGAAMTGLKNTGTLNLKNTGEERYTKDFCTAGGVIGKVRSIYTGDNGERFTLAGLEQNGTIHAENFGGIGGVLGGTYSCTLTLSGCTARGRLETVNTVETGGVMGRVEYHISDPSNMMYGGGGDDISMERCGAEMDILASGEKSERTGGVAASVSVGNNSLLGIDIRDCWHIGALTSEAGSTDGVCPGKGPVLRSWHSSAAETLVVTDSAAENGRYQLGADAAATGEAAWLLDGGEGEHLGIWTQKEGRPVLGSGSCYRVTAGQQTHGNILAAGGQAAYAVPGTEIAVETTSSETGELDGVPARYVLSRLLLTWQEGGESKELELTGSNAFTMPAGNGQLLAEFTLQAEPQPEPEPSTPPEQPEGGTTGGTGGGTGNGEGPGTEDGTGGGQETGSETGGETSGQAETGGESGGQPTEQAPGNQTPPNTGTQTTDGEDSVPEDAQAPTGAEEPQEQIENNTEDQPEAAGESTMDTQGSEPVEPEPEPEAQEPGSSEGGEPAGEEESPTIREILPEPLRQPHVLAAVAVLVLLLLAGGGWQYWRHRREKE